MGLLDKTNKSPLIVVILMGLSSVTRAGGVLDLPIPDELHAAMTIQQTFSGVISLGNEVLLFPEQNQFLVKMTFNPNGKDRESRFGKITDQQRIPLEGSAYPGDWRGAYANDNRLIVWDASLLQLLILRSKTFAVVQSMTVPADTLKPAADRMGEPTSAETTRTRQKFRSASRKIFGSKYTGFTEIPSKWEAHPGRKFLITTKVAGFPLVMMACEKDDDTACILKRQCFLEKTPKTGMEDIGGVGVFEDSREVLIGNKSANTIEVFRYNSCFDVVWSRSLKLPPRLPKFKNLNVDKSGRLWIVTASPDPYTDSNLFYWDREAWQSK